MAWALTMSQSTPAFQDAKTLQAMGWFDITAQLENAFPGKLDANYFWNEQTNTAFHVFENAVGQIVFAFRGSTSPITSLTNWAADLTTSDQGFSSYLGIGPQAQIVYNLMTESGSPYENDEYFADGHSLGGGLAQTFAVINKINGFSQDPLPISKGEVGIIGLTAIAYYKANYVFQNEELQGDVAAADFAGGTFAFSNTNTLWLESSYAATENKLVSSLSSKWHSIIPFSTTYTDVAV